jgi:hypothetical protein
MNRLALVLLLAACSDPEPKTNDNNNTPPPGPTGDGNDSFAEAAAISGATGFVDGELETLDDADYFRVEGTGGGAAYIFTDAKPDDDPFNPAYLDLVVTVFDASEQQIAQNDDPLLRFTQDSALPFVLPADGVAFIRVEDYCASDLADASCDAERDAAITEHGYSIGLLEIDFADAGYVDQSEPDSAGAPAMVTYAPTSTAGAYFMTLLFGAWETADDVDWFGVDLPDDLDVGTGIPMLELYATPGGADADGSAAEVGELTVWDATGATVLAQIDAETDAALRVPVDLAGDYLVTIGRGSGAMGPAAYYFVNHRGSASSNEPEVEPNDVYSEATALALLPEDNAYFCRGTLAPGGADTLDHYAFTAAQGDVVSVSCSSRTIGSGLRGFSAVLLDGATGQEIANSASNEETAGNPLRLEADVGTATNVVLQLTATSRDATVTGSYYQCGIHLPDL